MTTSQQTDGLWRWLLGGLAAGGVLLAVSISAYTVGYHRGQDETAVAAQATTTTAAPPTSRTAGRRGAPLTESELAGQGKTLFADNGCAACHSLDGSAGAGPSLEGAAGRKVELTDGSTVTADDAYLARAIADPDAQIVKGYRAGVMSAAISGFGLNGKPDDIRALVAFLQAQK